MIGEIIKKYNIKLEKREREKFKKFLKIFIEKNSQINLSAIRESKEIIEKHFIDSIILNTFYTLSGKVADIGTGGGFPGIPLAITNQNTQFTLIDSVQKKGNAIQDFITALNLTNGNISIGRAETLGHDYKYREQFDYVVSRATAYLPTLLEYAIPFLKVGGIFIAYKLDDKEELQSTKKALRLLKTKIEVVKNYKIGDQKRTLIFFRKQEETQKKYPRNIGVPLKKHL